MKKQFLETGKIVGTHGIQGEMRVEPWADSPESLDKIKTFYFDDGKTPLKIKSSRVHKNLLLIKADSVDSIEKADLLRGKIIFVNRDDLILEEGQTFVQDLIGLTVRDGNTDKIYGEITDVFKTGANDVYSIKSENGGEYLFPAVKHMIKSIDVDLGVIEVLPIAGIFDEEAVNDAH